MVALITILLLLLLFIASLFSLYPTKKTQLLGWLRSFFPNKAINIAPSYSSLKEPALDKEVSCICGVEKSAGGGSESSKVVYNKKVFATFDKNGDGFITRQELRESLKGMRILMTDEELDELVSKSDDNGDGLIDFDEFCNLLEEANMGGGDQDDLGLKEAFDVFDKDKDGLISVEELGLVLSSLGLISEGKKVEDCREMIKKVNMDGDGMVNFDEFKRMMTSGGPQLVSAF